jgi:signal transduction histidine kinase
MTDPRQTAGRTRRKQASHTIDRYVLKLIGSSLRHSFRTPLSLIRNSLAELNNEFDPTSPRGRLLLKRAKNPDVVQQLKYLSLEISEHHQEALSYYQELGTDLNNESMSARKISNILSRQVRNRLMEIQSRCMEVEQLLKPLQSADIHQLTEIMRVESNRMLRIFNGLIHLSNLNEQMDTKPSVSLIGRMRVACQQVRRNFGIDNEQDKLFDLPLGHTFIEAAEPLIDLLFQNLFENATRYALRAETFRVAATVDCRDFIAIQRRHSGITRGVEADGLWAEIHVTNSGPPVPPKDIDRIFRLYVTTERPTEATTGGGSGVGLALCQLICAMHGGFIGVNAANSACGDFVILLPVAQRNAVAPAELLPKLAGL